MDEKLKRTASDIPVTLGAFELLLSDYVESHHRVFGNEELQQIYRWHLQGLICKLRYFQKEITIFINSCGQRTRRAGTL